VADLFRPWGDGPIPFLVSPAAIGRTVRALTGPLLRSLRPEDPAPAPDIVLRRTLLALTVPGEDVVARMYFRNHRCRSGFILPY
jgi:hypothetical protein